jgi:hypothetical protein
MTQRRRIWLQIPAKTFTFLLVTLLAAAAGAQPPATTPPPTGATQGRGGQPAAAPQNLQVLPKDIPRPELITIMRGFTGALGVDCSYCHVEEPNRDFASDSKQPKKTARVMMQMVTHVNEMLATGIGKPADTVTKVQCITCHRGDTIPTAAAPAPSAAVAVAVTTPGR